MIDNKDIKNILITRTDRLGDVILTLPLINETKEIFKDAKIYFLVKKYAGELIKNYKDIDELIIEENVTSFYEKFKYFKNVKIDLVVNVKPRFDLALLFYLLRVKYRVGTAYRWYSFLYNYKVYEHRKDSVRHEADYNLNLLNKFTDKVNTEKKFYFNYTDEEKDNLNKKLNGLIDRDFIVVHPGSGGSAKDLPLETLIEFVNEFQKMYDDYEIVLTGTNEEKVLTGEIKNTSIKSDKVKDLCGSLNLRELMILTDFSKIFISNSTGPIHIAGALNKNIIGFYPNEAAMSEIRWKPLSNNLVILKPKDEINDMNCIKANDILISAEKFLN